MENKSHTGTGSRVADSLKLSNLYRYRTDNFFLSIFSIIVVCQDVLLVFASDIALH
jgi:hypothetical protein